MAIGYVQNGANVLVKKGGRKIERRYLKQAYIMRF
jgi:hypothetical protein